MSRRERQPAPEPLLLTPGEVARRFGCHPKTITRWAAQGKLSVAYTLGGHRRYLREEVEKLLYRQGRDAPPT